MKHISVPRSFSIYTHSYQVSIHFLRSLFTTFPTGSLDVTCLFPAILLPMTTKIPFTKQIEVKFSLFNWHSVKNEREQIYLLLHLTSQFTLLSWKCGPNIITVRHSSADTLQHRMLIVGSGVQFLQNSSRIEKVYGRKQCTFPFMSTTAPPLSQKKIGRRHHLNGLIFPFSFLISEQYPGHWNCDWQIS